MVKFPDDENHQINWESTGSVLREGYMANRKENLLKKYEERQSIYCDFAQTVRSIIINILNNDNHSNPYLYQLVSGRSKSLDSLSKKLDQYNFQNLKAVDDLAGCRVVFYRANDIDIFTNLIYQNFKVLKNNLRYSVDDYNGRHIVVALTEEKLKLPEYSRFKDLKCEIQLTTVLFHAWSEMAHDIIYKTSDDIKTFDKPQFDAIKSRFNKIMEKYLWPATHEFTIAVQEFENLKKGIEIFSYDYFELISNSNSINSLYERLYSLKEYVEYFGDKTPQDINIISILRDSVDRAKEMKIEPIKTILGESPGKTPDDVIEVCLDILTIIRYQLPKEIIEFTIYFSNYPSNKVSDKANNLIKKISEYNLTVIEKVGLGFQIIVIEELESWDYPSLWQNFDATLIMAREILNPMFEGINGDYKTIIKSGPLPVTEALKSLRKRTIKLIQKLYTLTNNLSQKKKVINGLELASQFPDRENYGEDMKQMILSDVEDVINFYIKIIPKSPSELIQNIEYNAYWFYRHGVKNFSPPKNIGNLRNIIDANQEYEIFKTLVGSNSVSIFPPQWEDETWYRTALDDYRKHKVDEYISKVNNNNFKIWLRRILEYSKIKSDDNATFRYFKKFLKRLGEKKPELALKVIRGNEEQLKNFMIPLLKGLWNSSANEETRKILGQWSKEGKYLDIVARVLECAEEVDIEIITLVIDKAKENKDTLTLTCVLETLVNNFEPYFKQLFISIIKELTKLKYTIWVGSIWYRSNPNEILESFTEEEIDVILENLLYSIILDRHLEYILVSIANSYPQKIIDHFKKRVAIKDEKTQYEAIPFQLHKLFTTLAEEAELIIPQIIQWFDKEQYRLAAETLLHKMFPTIDERIEPQLLKLIDSGQDRNICFVLELLRKYNGHSSIFGICKEVIKKYPEDLGYRNRVLKVLKSTGVVTGEYGFVKTYRNKIAQTKDWLEDDNKYIKEFAKEFHRDLEKRIREETKRVDENIEIRKRLYSDSKDDTEEDT